MTRTMENAKRGPSRFVSAVKVGSVIWLAEDPETPQLVVYVTSFSPSLKELTLRAKDASTKKVTLNGEVPVDVEEPPTIAELLRGKKDPKEVTVSFEYFPPKTEKGAENLMARIGLMAEAQPVFCDMTWGAGGSTSDLTLQLCVDAQRKWGVHANMHLTCTNMEKEKIDRALEGCKAAGIRNVVALRGDPPAGETEWKAIDTGFKCALDLVNYIRSKHGDYFCLTVAGYPEGHPTVIAADGKCPPDAFANEMAYLKQKVDAGGDLIITQLFLDVDLFLSFAEQCKRQDILCPVIPGIMIITSYAGFVKMTGFCKTWIPPEMAAHMETIKTNEAAVKEYGLQYATEMCQRLIGAGHTHLHFYCLNLEGPTFAVMQRLGLPVPAK